MQIFQGKVEEPRRDHIVPLLTGMLLYPEAKFRWGKYHLKLSLSFSDNEGEIKELHFFIDIYKYSPDNLNMINLNYL